MGFTVEETVWITLADGTRLAARVWMPERQAEGQGPFPAVLEFLPYRRRDGNAERDRQIDQAEAGRGGGADVEGRGDQGSGADLSGARWRGA